MKRWLGLFGSFIALLYMAFSSIPVSAGPTTGEVTGTIRYASSPPVPIVGIVVYLKNLNTADPPSSTATDASGGYSFTNLPWSNYRVTLKYSGPGSLDALGWWGWESATPEVTLSDSNPTAVVDFGATKKLHLTSPFDNQGVTEKYSYDFYTTDTTLHLAWDVDPDAFAYEVQVNVLDTWDLVYWNPLLTTNGITVPATFSPGKEYHCMVRSYNASNWGLAEFDFDLNIDTNQFPEISVTGNGTEIPSGDFTPSNIDNTYFGSTAVAGGTVDRTFIIKNTGAGALTLTGTPKVSLIGANASDFTVTVQPTSPVPASGQTDFTVRFDPSAVGLRSALISIASDDADDSPYAFAIQGTGTEALIVGGEVSMPNKLSVITPWLALLLVIGTCGVLIVRRYTYGQRQK